MQTAVYVPPWRKSARRAGRYVRFWDTSAIIPLILEEPASGLARTLLEEDGDVVVWWATRVEAISALVRRTRESELDATGEAQARLVLVRLVDSWSEVQPTSRLRAAAERALAVHTLRAADALQLAAALRWCDGEPGDNSFVCLDERLREAARKEGFHLLPA